MPQDFTVAVEDESIFIHNVLIRRKMWTPQGVRPTVTITGSHQKTCVFGTFSIDGRQTLSPISCIQSRYIPELSKRDSGEI